MTENTHTPSQIPAPDSKEPGDDRAQKPDVLGPSFYRSILNVEGKERFDDAHKVQGLDAEIAILRWRIRNILQKDRKHQKNPQLLKAIELLIRAYSAKTRALKDSPDADDDAIGNMIKDAADNFGLTILPWDSNC